jgi:coenzyme Q-binding protein COQ10
MLRPSIERELPYTPEQLFDIAADVGRYPEFLPWWIAVRVRGLNDDGYCTDQVLGLGPARMTFASRTTLDRPRRIDVTSNDPAFQQFNISWLFERRPNVGCLVSLSVDLKLRSPLLQTFLELAVPDATSDIILAFEARVRQLYGAQPA